MPISSNNFSRLEMAKNGRPQSTFINEENSKNTIHNSGFDIGTSMPIPISFVL